MEDNTGFFVGLFIGVLFVGVFGSVIWDENTISKTAVMQGTQININGIIYQAKPIAEVKREERTRWIALAQ